MMHASFFLRSQVVMLHKLVMHACLFQCSQVVTLQVGDSWAIDLTYSKVLTL